MADGWRTGSRVSRAGETDGSFLISVASLPCPALPSAIFSDGQTLFLVRTPGPGGPQTWTFEGPWEVGVGPIRGAGKYILALVTDYSSQSVWKAQSHISLLDQQDLPISQLARRVCRRRVVVVGNFRAPGLARGRGRGCCGGAHVGRRMVRKETLFLRAMSDLTERTQVCDSWRLKCWCRGGHSKI